MSNIEAQDLTPPSLEETAKKWPVLSEKQRFQALNQLIHTSEDTPSPLEWPSRELSFQQRQDAFYTIYNHQANKPAYREILYRIFAKELRDEQLSPEIIHYSARSIFLRSQAHHAILAKLLYRKALKLQQREGPWSGQITPLWTIGLQTLEKDLVALLESGTCHCLKTSHQGGVYAGNLNGQEVVIKVFNPQPKKWKDRWRAGRARKSWAAAVTMHAMGIRTPQPLAYLESTTPNNKAYFITERIPGTLSARAWVKPHLHRQPYTFQSAFRRQLFHHLIDLYEAGLYHGDTKLGNLLVSQPDSPAERHFYWIDLDSVVPAKPSMRQILRNLIQLNGSTGRNVSPEQRRAFLKELAILYPWVDSPKIWRYIENVTRKRLLRELHRICGH